MITSLNLCEVLSPHLAKDKGIENILEKAQESYKKSFDRLHIGSNFCSQYFLKMMPYWNPVFDYASFNEIPITLTVPIFSQKDLNRAKESITSLVEKNCIDEITVNDFGLLEFFRKNYQGKLNLGRLFFKDPRDVRVPGYYNHQTSYNMLSHLESFPDIEGIELDLISRDVFIPKDLTDQKTVSIHFPYTYMTVGNICKFAGIGKETTQKFRPNASCQLDCSYIHEFFVESFDRKTERELFRFGRTIYYLNDSLNLEDKTYSSEEKEIDRLIYFPLKELALW